MPTSEPARLRVGAALILLCVIASVYALSIAVSGGFTIRAGGFRFSTHDTLRPIAVALGLGASAVWWLGADASRIRSRFADSLVHRYGLAIAVTAAAAIGTACFVFGAHIASGADASGYLSQARLWRAGNLRVSTPAALEADAKHGQYAFTPLGYQPSQTRGVVVPGYPPGLPLHFAAVSAVAGERAQFAIPPLSAAGIVIIAFLLARRIGGNELAVIAMAACATSPVLLLLAVQPMSDATAAVWWTLAVLLLTYDAIPAAAAAGVAAGIACAVRPNLFVMVPLLNLLAVWWHTTPPTPRAAGIPAGGVRTFGRWTAFLAGPAVVALGIAWLHKTLYGSVSTSGYGAVGALFSIDHVWPNLARYSQWAIHAQSVLIAVPLAAPFVVHRAVAGFSRLSHQRVVSLAWSALVFAAGLQAFFLLYLVLDDWISVRFLLPALPWLLVMQALVFAAIYRTLVPQPLHGVAALVIAMLIASWGIDRARAVGVFQLHESERRYLQVATFARTLPAGAVFLTLHHSGSLPYYASAAIVRWDWIEPDEIDRVVSELRVSRRHVFAVIDDIEEPQFTQRFAGTRTLAQLSTPVFSAGTRTGITSRVYALTE